MTYTLIYFEYGSSECIFLSLRREIWFEDIQQKTKYVDHISWLYILLSK